MKYTKSSRLSWNEVEAIKHPERFRLLCKKCHDVTTFLLRDPKRATLVLTNLHKIR